MIGITCDQFEALRLDSEVRFLSGICQFVDRHVDNRRPVIMSELQQRVSSQIVRARSFGLTSEYDVVAYVLAAQMIAPEFDQQPDVLRFLSSQRTPSEKAQFLDTIVSETFRMAQEGI